MLKSAARGFRVATWLGWQIESNWADPFLFFIYSVLRPIASVMILVVMYLVISQSETQSPLFAYIYIGNAFYIFVTSVIVGVSWAVIDDREHYGTLKYIYLSPIPYISYLFGRGVARLLTSLLAVVVTLGFGVLVLGVPIHWSELNLPLFFVTFAVGIIALALTLMLTFAGCQNAPQPQKTDVAADTAAINALRDQFLAAWNSNDAAALAATYADDAIMMDPNQASVEGKQAIRAAYEARFKESAFKAAVTPLETQVAGDWAYDRGNLTATVTPKSGKPMEESGKYLFIFKRQPDGSWKVYRDISNSNSPPPTAGGNKK